GVCCYAESRLQAGRFAYSVEGRHVVQQLLRIRREQGGSRPPRRHAQDPSVDGQGRRLVREAEGLRHRRDLAYGASRGADLLAAVRGGLVHGDSLDRLSTGDLAEAGGTDEPGSLRGIHDAARSRTVSRAEEGAVQLRVARMALLRGASSR